MMRHELWRSLVLSYISRGESYDEAARAADEVMPLIFERLATMAADEGVGLLDESESAS